MDENPFLSLNKNLGFRVVSFAKPCVTSGVVKTFLQLLKPIKDFEMAHILQLEC